MAAQDPFRALEEAKKLPNVPRYADFAVVATWLPDQSTESKLTLQLETEDGLSLGPGWVFPEEWYPGVKPEHQVRFSHYFLALKRAFRGLMERQQRPTLRLQVLKFVYSRGRVVLLKFVIGPEYSLNATQLQGCYNCPLQAFFVNFVGLSRDVTQPPGEPRYVAGNAIHLGYSRAAMATWRVEPYEARLHAYWAAVTDVWTSSIAHLAVDDVANGLKAYHRQPLEVVDHVLTRCREKVEGAHQLLQERYFFSPTRGMAGKADRVVRSDHGWHVYEIKTSSTLPSAADPRTGERVPGGIQSVAYLEILRTHSQDPASASVEEFRSTAWREVPLEEHPVILRAKASPLSYDDGYIDLWAQLRNVTYVTATGLGTGYNRQRIAELAFNGHSGHRLRGLGGRFELYGPRPPCSICPAHQRGVCDADRKKDSASWPNFWLHIPQRLWEYWAWFHYQLKQEEALERVRLFRMATADPNELERREGTCITGLSLIETRGRRVVLQRHEAIVTRIRPDDQVLLTPTGSKPGGLSSIAGVVVRMEGNRIHLELFEEMQELAESFRLDQLGRYELIDWGIKGITDFLLNAMTGSGKFARPVPLQELPAMARAILGAAQLGPLVYAQVDPDLLTGLNDGQAQALRAALALEPGEFLLIQGPPGTGKTQTIARLAHLLVLRELWHQSPMRPVLILAYTHRASDEIVRKLLEIPELAPFVIRVGDPRSTTDSAVRGRILGEMVGARERMDRVLRDPTDLSPLRTAIQHARLRWDQALVFVGTLASAERPELAGLTFSTVIVDEAGQATEPHTLQALRHMPKGFRARLVLVGDHFQLPPVVQDVTVPPDLHPQLAGLKLDPDRGLQVSLFERLALLYPQRLLTLQDQFRMNQSICSLVGDVFYQGRLRPASREVAERQLFALSPETLKSLDDPRLALLWDPARPVVFIDTSDDPRALEERNDLSREEVRANPREADIVAWLVGGLLQRLPSAEAEAVAGGLGIISAYRSQNNLMANGIRDVPYANKVRVDTVDRFQGSECEVVVVSLVDNNASRSLSKLHRDWRRLNVAISRARSKLILVGSRDNFTGPGPSADEQAKALYRRLFAVMDQLHREGSALILSSRELP